MGPTPVTYYSNLVRILGLYPALQATTSLLTHWVWQQAPGIMLQVRTKPQLKRQIFMLMGPAQTVYHY